MQGIYTPSSDFYHNTGYAVSTSWRVDTGTASNTFAGQGPGTIGQGYTGCVIGEIVCAR